MRISAPLALLLSLATACTSAPKSEPVTIELKGAPGTSTETRYYSSSRTLAYSEGQLLRDRIESVEFSVKMDVKNYDPATKILKYKVRTIRKDGKVELNDLAFPELNQEIDYVVHGATATVVQASAYSTTSIFFVPSMPLPKGPVQVGDTWSMEHTWYSRAENIPLKLDLIGILKNTVRCEGGKTCADVEVSGRVELLNLPTTAGSRFQSKIWGRMLFSLERGDVIWSEMRSQEEMGVTHERVNITSCTVSETKLSKDYKTKVSCEPGVVPVEKIPSL